MRGLFFVLYVMSIVVLFNKPYGVLCQFSPQAGRRTLKDYLPQSEIYPAGRLDADSEGLVVLTADGALQHRITDPAHKLSKTYLVQVEGVPTESALEQLRSGVALAGFTSRPAVARGIDAPSWLWVRAPAVRERRAIPTSWLEITLAEGKNRQVRRMTAAVGFPALRLIRYAISKWTIAGIDPGRWREIEVATARAGPAHPRREQSVGDGRQPIRKSSVKGRAIPHPLKRKKQ
ncbi:MAG: rRNA pseudouridine2457 synthase [Betaproteobacteria bacterium]|jgi:23S rRNA pseudouridine2457 synthase